MTKTEYTVDGNSVIFQYRAEGYEPSVVLEVKDGQILLHSREYTGSQALTQVVLGDVANGDVLKVGSELTERRLLTVRVNSKTATHQLNWPSYRGIDLQLSQVESVKKPKRKPVASE